MAITRKLVASAVGHINTTKDKVSFVKLVTRGGDTFKKHDTLSVKTSPISDAENNGLKFTATIVKSKTHATQTVLKLVAAPTRGVVPTDGLLSITLVDDGVDVQVVDFPVTYIDDSDFN